MGSRLRGNDDMEISVSNFRVFGQLTKFKPRLRDYVTRYGRFIACPIEK
jgi:hypothetical protein